MQALRVRQSAARVTRPKMESCRVATGRDAAWTEKATVENG
jgi:hypothetical protein